MFHIAAEQLECAGLIVAASTANQLAPSTVQKDIPNSASANRESEQRHFRLVAANFR